MRKRWVAIFLLLWILAGTQVMKSGLSEKEEQITEVFGRIGTEERNSQTEYFGKIKGSFMESEERKEFLLRMAEELGLKEVGEPQEEEKEGHILTQIIKESARAKTELKILTMNSQEQYVCVRIYFEDDLHSAMYYRTQLQNLLEDEVEEAQNTTTAYGIYRGKLTQEQRDEIADDILECFGARTVSQSKTENLYTIYGYTGGINDYIMQGDLAVNINVAMTYNEERDTTQVYMAIPVMSENY